MRAPTLTATDVPVSLDARRARPNNGQLAVLLVRVIVATAAALLTAAAHAPTIPSTAKLRLVLAVRLRLGLDTWQHTPPSPARALVALTSLRLQVLIAAAAATVRRLAIHTARPSVP